MEQHQRQNPENLIALITDGNNPHFKQPAKIIRYLPSETGAPDRVELLYADNATEIIPENKKGFGIFVRAAGRNSGN